jgi:hypothetical protein
MRTVAKDDRRRTLRLVRPVNGIGTRTTSFLDKRYQALREQACLSELSGPLFTVPGSWRVTPFRELKHGNKQSI